MKNVFTMTLILLLVGLFAATAFAQDGESGKKQSKARTANYNEVASDTDGRTARNGNDGGYQEQGGPHDGEGPMGEGSGSGGESGSGGDSAQGGSDGSGSGSGSGSGDGSGSSGEKVFVDNDGDGFADCEVRLRKNGKLAGTMTETRVQDGNRTQQRGGGSGEGSGDSGEKIFDGADGQGEMSGGSVKGNANDHGPGGDDPAMGDGLGPNEDGVGFGEPEDEGDGEMVRNRGKNNK